MRKSIAVNMLKKLIIIIACFSLLYSFSGVSSAKSYNKKTISWVQQALKTLKYYHGKITGVLDKNTIEAVKAFQKDKGLRVDGIPGRKTRKELKKALEEQSNQQKKLNGSEQGKEKGSQT